MKPIALQLTGLQSYQEEQHIDFRRLCETGLFGIFGPTGSGKSTILDAMTLTLYGKVSRATNGTQGILNQTENQLFVSFTFELDGAGERRVFRVERRFKRTGDVTVSNTVSRFVEMLPRGEVVMADKPGEVTRCVEQYIGLKMDDFTRAVVLPQGKFAEFLSLKGSERRQMLQRLFSLERYGDELAARISCCAKDADEKMIALAAEQQGLGDASQQAVQLAEQAWAAARARAHRAREAKLVAMNEYQQMAEQRQLQQEYEQISQRRERLQAQAPQRADEEARLKRAREAHQLVLLVEETEQLAAKQETLARRFKLDEEKACVDAEQAQRDKCVAEEAKRIQECEEPVWLRRSEQLQEAISYQQKRDGLRKEENAWRERLAAAHQRYSALSMEIARLEQVVKKAASRQEELRALLVAHAKPAQEQEQFRLAVSQYEKISLLEHRCKELEQGYQKQLEQANKVHRLRGVELEQLVSVAANIRCKLTAGLRIKKKWRGIRERLAIVAEQIEAGMEDERQQYWQDVTKQVAMQLAATLPPAAPCPVCGSVSHPKLAHAVAGSFVTDMQAGDERQKQWKQVKSLANRLVLEADREAVHRREQFSSWLHRLRDISVRASLWAQEREELMDGEDKLVDDERTGQHGIDEQAAASSISPHEKELRHDSVISLVASMTGEHASKEGDERQSIRKGDPIALETELTVLQYDMQIVVQEIGKLARQLEPLLKQAADTQWKLQEFSSAHKSAAAAAGEARSRKEEASQLLMEQRKEWTLHFAAFHWTWEHMPARQTEWLASEAIVMDCRERLEKSAAHMEQMKDSLNQHRQLRQTAEVEQVHAQAEENGIARLIADYEAHLQPWQGNSLVQLQAAASARLAELRAQAKQSFAAAERSRVASEASGRQAALSKQAWVNLSEQATGSIQRLEKQLATSSFHNVAELRVAIMSEQQCVLLENELAAYAEEVRDVSSQLKRLEKRIGSTRLSDEQWAACKANQAACEAADEAAVAAKAKAEQDAEQITSKHARWMQLEAVRSCTEKYAGRLHQLQSVFRGNAFVEFIAEEQLIQVSRTASTWLKQLTKQRYALEVDSGGGFVIRDDSNGGLRRPVSTLSGGETFLTSLALALALSSQIQLRGKYPLEFFFLDEGFGTLDPELLDTVLTALEKLHSNRLSVGVISHVPELQARLARKLVVLPAEQAGRGSRIVSEMK